MLPRCLLPVLLLWTMAAVASAEPGQFTLDQLLERAWEHNTDVAVARLDVEGARSRVKEARAAHLLPRLRLESFGGLVPDAEGDIFNPPGDTSGVRPLGPFVRAELQFIQPLYTFGQLSNLYDAASAGVDVERADLEARRQDVALEVKELYYGVLLAQDLSDLAARLRGELEQWEPQVSPDNADIPLGAPYKLRLALIELANREREISDGLALARAALAWKVGLDESAAYSLGDQWLAPVNADVPAVDALLETAIGHRPDWQKLGAGIAARSAQERAARSAFYPQVFLAGGLRYAAAPGRTDQHNPFVKDEYNLLNGAVVLGLRQSFEFGMLNADLDRARSLRLQLEARRQSALQGIRLEIESAHGEVHRTEQEREGALEARNLVREWVQIARDEFELDPSQVKELVSAFEALAGSEEAYYRAIFDFNMAVARLERIVGVTLRDAGDTP
ncbi:MAG TPA: TolC family protein [Candidatus Latescibacteria bacterium]|nr:TolC family protein [Candidatus Latescibacterota bacterium]HJP29368.1 TolC family protein [Candidatus Latescibacterota bacterium]